MMRTVPGFELLKSSRLKGIVILTLGEKWLKPSPPTMGTVNKVISRAWVSL